MTAGTWIKHLEWRHNAVGALGKECLILTVGRSGEEVKGNGSYAGPGGEGEVSTGSKRSELHPRLRAVQEQKQRNCGLLEDRVCKGLASVSFMVPPLVPGYAWITVGAQYMLNGSDRPCFHAHMSE